MRSFSSRESLNALKNSLVIFNNTLILFANIDYNTGYLYFKEIYNKYIYSYRNYLNFTFVVFNFDTTLVKSHHKDEIIPNTMAIDKVFISNG